MPALGFDDLLAPATISLEEAQRVASRYLATRWKRWSLAERLVPRAERPAFLALCAWHRLLRSSSRGGLDDMTKELEAVYASRPRSPLGIVLRDTVHRLDLPQLLFRGPLELLSQGPERRTRETRGQVLADAKRLAHPEGRLLLRAANATNERNEVLVDALSTGLQLTSWIAHLRSDLERGELHLPVEDLTRFRVDIAELQRGEASDNVRRLLFEEIAWARGHLAKGWPLCKELGPWRGRLCAFFLRWQAATLSALEARGLAPTAAPPRGGWLRLAACGSVAAVTRAAPRFG